MSTDNGQTKITLHRRLLAFHMAVGKIRKTGTNPHFRSRYADINAVLETVMPVLTSNGIILVQMPDIIENVGHVLVTYLVNADDKTDFIKSTTPLILPKHDMQAYGSAVTYARRYALISMLDLETVDDDGNRAVQPQQQQQQYPQGGSYAQASRG